jgi:hypothetical protein
MVGGKPRRESSQKRAIRRFVNEITFTGFSSERDGPLKFWTVDSHNTHIRMCYSLGSFTTLEEAVAFFESAKRQSSQ